MHLNFILVHFLFLEVILLYDMHIHSTYSDGQLTPEEIQSKMKSWKIKGSIIDHDNVKYYLDQKDTVFIPGVEFGLTYKGEEIHLLAYFIDPHNEQIMDLTTKLQKDRMRRIHKTVALLEELGISITIEEIKMKSKGSILSRSHIGEILYEKGYTKSIKDSFNKYLNPGKPAYVEKKAVNVEHILHVIRTSNAVSILAHPKTIKDQSIVLDIIDMGVDGIEIINSKHSYSEIIHYIKLAERFQLIKTCGSDCHGKEYNGRMLLGYYGMNYKALKPMIHLHQLRKKGL